MRLTKRQTAEATAQLVEVVRQFPGVSTSQLIGTPKFHATRTLRPTQVIRLLRAAGLTPSLEGAGARTFYSWTVRS